MIMFDCCCKNTTSRVSQKSKLDDTEALKTNFLNEGPSYLKVQLALMSAAATSVFFCFLSFFFFFG